MHAWDGGGWEVGVGGGGGEEMGGTFEECHGHDDDLEEAVEETDTGEDESFEEPGEELFGVVKKHVEGDGV